MTFRRCGSVPCPGIVFFSIWYLFKLFKGSMNAPTGSTYSWSSFSIGFFLVIFAIFKKGSFNQLDITRVLRSLDDTDVVVQAAGTPRLQSILQSAFSIDKEEDQDALQPAGTTPLVANMQLAAGVFMMVYGLFSSLGGMQFQKIQSLIPVDRSGRGVEQSYQSISLFKIKNIDVDEILEKKLIFL